MADDRIDPLSFEALSRWCAQDHNAVLVEPLDAEEAAEYERDFGFPYSPERAQFESAAFMWKKKT